MIKIYTSTPPGVAKDFQSWSYAKYRINARKGHPPAYKERDVWWMSIGHYHFSVKGKMSNALLSQLRVFDAKRLISKHGMVNEVDFYDIKQRLVQILG